MSRSANRPKDTINTINNDPVTDTVTDLLTATINHNITDTIILEVSAAYNRDGLPMPKPNGPNGRRVLDLEMLMNHPLYWDFLNERETEEVLMELYITRTRRMQ